MNTFFGPKDPQNVLISVTSSARSISYWAHATFSSKLYICGRMGMLEDRAFDSLNTSMNTLEEVSMFLTKYSG